MCNSKGCCSGGRGMCNIAWTSKILLIIGGLNWGLVGLGMLFGSSSWNVINVLLGSIPTVEAIIYVLVGLAALAKIFGGCRCRKCSGGGTMEDKPASNTEATT